MNHLAHFYLAENPATLIPGAFLGDYVKGRLAGNFSSSIEQGIFLHRRIDSYTDHHPLVRQGHRLFTGELRRYAPIVVDVLYDHLLALNWSDWHDTSLDEFSNLVFDNLLGVRDLLPVSVRHIPERMRSHDSLCRYADPEFIVVVLEHLSTRLSRPSQLAGAWNVFEQERSQFDEDFRRFFSELIGFTTLEKEQLTQARLTAYRKH